ncbi:MAG TPA: hypothetical protein DCR87_06100, partial [Acidobacteria bacterium]|nr:hypothetical protein [Acidobacteriota bacterium]
MPDRKKVVFKIKIPRLNRKKVLKGLLLSLVLLVALALGGFFGAYLAIRENLPDVGELEQIKPKIISAVYADNGQLAREFAAERRIQVPYEKIPEVLKQAIIATEDPRFFAHKGIDYRGILRALKEDFFRIVLGKSRLHGGSTITQQLARS